MCQASLSHYMNRPTNSFYARGFGASAPWIDLVNSALLDGFGNRTECLDDPVWVRTFLQYWKLRGTFREPEPRKALRDLRDLLRHLVEKGGSQGSLSSEDLAELNAWLKIPIYALLVENQSGFALRLQPAKSGWRAALAEIVRSFADSLIQQPLERLKICANVDCRWVFVDRTKGNVRRWCDDKTCGNRDRVRRSRAAHRK